MDILITGGAGFIGSHVADQLLTLGHAVHVLDNFNADYNPARKRRNVQLHLTNPAYHLHEGDIRDERGLRKLFCQTSLDLVIHLAALAGVQPSLLKPQSYSDVNVGGTQTLLETMRAYGVRKLIFGSSSSVYGEADPLPLLESTPDLHPISPYARTKYEAEQVCRHYHHQYAVDVTCLRFFTVYGPRQRPDMAIPQFIRALMKQEAIRIFGQNSSRDYTHVSDIVQGICKALPLVDGFSIYNLGSGRRVTIQQLVSIVEQATGQTANVIQELNRIGDVGHTWADLTKARQQLVYEPTVYLQEGIGQMVRELEALQTR